MRNSSHIKNKGHHTRLERHGEKGIESMRLDLISRFLLWYSSSAFFLECEGVFIIVDGYYSEFSRLRQRTKTGVWSNLYKYGVFGFVHYISFFSSYFRRLGALVFSPSFPTLWWSLCRAKSAPTQISSFLFPSSSLASQTPKIEKVINFFSLHLSFKKTTCP